jgi:DNA-directed RNA polymerase subunit omega
MSSRYSNEDAVKRIPNRFDLVLVAAQRVRELRNGHQPLVKTNNGVTLTALQEIEAGHVTVEHLKRIGNRHERTQTSNRNKKRP